MHGTSPDGAVGITDGGFRLDLTGSHAGTMFGSLAAAGGITAVDCGVTRCHTGHGSHGHPNSLPWNARTNTGSSLYL